ncbi:MAG: valine--tRNA ligase [Methylocella sp.]|nr:MAG: valine--tRNA ligase [Hyphomicrobiales bacterium]
MMEKTFDPKAVEGRIASAWQEAGAFRAGRPERAGAAAFTVVIPPPNVTGSLHMGHALNTTLQDILCRFERMRGRDVLWQPGTDHAGIATQMVVERQLMERQEPGRVALGREKFLARVWEWKAKSGGAIIDQLQRLGASCDWSRERFTLDDGLSRAVAKVFVQLYKEGLIYKDKRLVNWDPQLQTAISDLEVVQVETKGHLWHFKYPVVDEAGRETGEYIVVATTRPETMLGDTAVAVNPSDARYLHLQGKCVRLPLVGRLIPIVADEYSDPEKGTGAVKITPAHDFNDFEVGRRHELLRSIIMDERARIKTENVFAEYEAEKFDKEFNPEPGLIYVSKSPILKFFAGEPDEELKKLNDKDRFVVRTAIVEMMEARGFLEKIEPHTHMVPHGDRSGAVIEPYLTDQWYVDAKELAESAHEAVRVGKTRFIPKNWENTYFDWLENIQPWCISRQLWWGHRIPAWYGPDDERFVEPSEKEAIAAAKARYRRPVVAEYPSWMSFTEQFESILAQQYALKEGSATPITITRDPDVLDTWFSSALWPFSTLGWPEETPDLKRRYPTSALVTGFDIIFFWVARMMMMGLHFMGEVPFRDVYIHALVRDEKGAKMSKSKGNVVDPLHLIDTYGADALRFTLAAMAAQGRDIKLSTQRIEGYRNFGTKLWNAARFAEMNGCVFQDTFNPRQTSLKLNGWIVGETAKTIAEVSAAVESYRFNDAANAAYRFVWNIFCDWYLELAKPLLQGADGPAKDETRATTAFVREQIVKLLHPFMPFMTEELWAITTGKELPRATLLALAKWPELDGCENPEAEAEIGFIVELISEIRSVRAEMNVPAAAQIPLMLVNASPETKSRAKNWDETIKHLARLSEISFAPEAPQKSVQMVVRKTVAALPLQGIIDFEAEKTRLAKEIAKLKGDADKIEAKLRNADFVARAPEEVVEENRERQEDALSRMEKLAAALAKLGGA